MFRKLLMLVLALAITPAYAADELHVYNWNDYIAPETLKRFEATCHCKVVYDTYGSNEELLAKLAAGAKGYDVLVPTGFALSSLIKQNVLLPLDHAKLPNMKNIKPEFLNTPFDRGNRYSMPYAYSTTIMGYNIDKMKQFGMPMDSWAAIFDPKYVSKFKGHVTVLDDQRELMAAALKYLGYSVNDTNLEHWKRAEQVIIKAKPYWAAFNNTSYIREISSGNIWLCHCYSNDMYQAKNAANQANRGVHLDFSIPREGAVLALDNMVIPRSAPRPDLALKFINFIMEPQSAAALTNLTGSGCPNAPAMKLIKPAILANKALFPDKETSRRLEQLADLDRAQRLQLSRIWSEIKLR